ncbi:MAG: DUF4926 domain-containing protein [Deltaproteobacteria bacterium]|nr:DUF4926 domain-containing protein [Deltaproteobacteria bacterium]MBI3391086.1 DUF4926 domain-containing protein [Deltaproteobacteria bacterium]
MRSEIHLHDVVALLEDIRANHFETGEPLLLRRGQIGTVVMKYDDTVEVEFADRSGRAYALQSISTARLMVLHDSPDHPSVVSAQ